MTPGPDEELAVVRRLGSLTHTHRIQRVTSLLRWTEAETLTPSAAEGVSGAPHPRSSSGMRVVRGLTSKVRRAAPANLSL